MKPISLNLAAKRDLRTLLWMGAILLVAAIALIERRYSAEAELQSWQQKWAKLDERFASRSRASCRPGLVEEIARANRIIARLGIPWGQLFSAVDATTIDDVALLSVEPDSDHRSVRISAEAKDRKAMLDYLRTVQHSSILRDGYIASYQINNQDPQKPLRFVVNAFWNEASQANSGSVGEPGVSE